MPLLYNEVKEVRNLGFKREDIRDTSPLSLKKLNDTLRFLWLKVTGNIEFGDLSSKAQGVINDKVGNTTFTQVIDDVNGAIATKVSDNEFGTKIQQSASDVKIAVGRIGSNNLIRNGNFQFGTANWRVENASWYGSNGFYPPSATEGFLSTDTFSVKPGKTYSFSCRARLEGNTTSFDAFFIGSANNDRGYGWTPMLFTTSVKDQTLNVIGTFTVPNGINYGYIRLDHNGRTNTSGGYVIWIEEVMLCESDIPQAYMPHPSELKSSIAEFTDDHFRVSYQDGSYTEMNSQGFKWHNGSTSKDYHYLIETGRCITIGDDVSSVWVQLPDEFKGKPFKVTAHVEDSYNGGNTARAIQKFNTYITGYDYPNGKVAILGYRNEIDVNTGVITRDALGINWTAIV